MGRVVVIGGGIAGVATAWGLAMRGRDVVLLEKEAQLGAHSTGLNAAIFRLAVAEPINVRLAQRSRAIGEALVEGGVVRSLGGFYLCDDDDLRAAILEASASAGVRPARSGELPSFLSERARPTLVSPDDGVIDVAALLQGLARTATSNGARLRLGALVSSLDLEGGRVVGVIVDGERIAAETVVDATGAWSPALVGAAESDVAIRPHRRHLFVLDTPETKAISNIVWDLTEAIYVRPESGGVLVSPCDETAMAARDAIPTDPEVRAILFDKLARWAPSLAHATVRRWWAGLRPLTPDHRFVVGPDPLLGGLFRVGGFGGHGMTAGPAAGELAARLLCGEHVSEADELSPNRFALVQVHPTEARIVPGCC